MWIAAVRRLQIWPSGTLVFLVCIILYKPKMNAYFMMLLDCCWAGEGERRGKGNSIIPMHISKKKESQICVVISSFRWSIRRYSSPAYCHRLKVAQGTTTIILPAILNSLRNKLVSQRNLGKSGFSLPKSGPLFNPRQPKFPLLSIRLLPSRPSTRSPSLPVDPTNPPLLLGEYSIPVPVVASRGKPKEWKIKKISPLLS